jgi:WhiB family transcriptional regulator, redox-sensing transcriptional regulator
MIAIEQLDYEEGPEQEPDWRRAACRTGGGALTPLFFSEEPIDIARAKSICRRCPLADPCFEGAVERSEPWGVWGGQLFFNGKVLAFKRKRGRPPKNPIPLPEIA